MQTQRVLWITIMFAASVSTCLVRGQQATAPSNSSPLTFAGHPVRPDDGKLAVIQLGAHPDDCELRAGGTAALWAKAGHHVKFVSLTSGDIGHFQMAGGPLAKRRNDEVQAAAKVLGVTSQVLDNHDGELMPTLENRKLVTSVIRQWNPDIVIGHRPNDYHPDHRYTGVLMQDCAYMVGVPFLCPDVPHMKKAPVFLFSADNFQRPNPFRPDIVIAIDDVIEQKLDALGKIESQFIEGGCDGNPGMVPANEAERKTAHDNMREGFRRRFGGIANKYRDRLIEIYGPDKGKQIRYAEAFEICEYGRQPTPQEIRKLFPFLPEPR
jgi:LmbE family N-acetylglucosaminyl deacetylase